MGILGGLHVLRTHNDMGGFNDPNIKKNLLHAIFPWGGGSSVCCNKLDGGRKNTKTVDKNKRTRIWRKRVDFCAFLYVGLLTALCVTKIALDVTYSVQGE